MYVTDALRDQGYADGICKAMKDAKGQGNFCNMLVYAPGGRKDGLQIIPISEVAARGDIFNIKNVSRDDVLATHRVPPQLLGLVPTNSGGFGTSVAAVKVRARNELEPLQLSFWHPTIGSGGRRSSMRHPLVPALPRLCGSLAGLCMRCRTTQPRRTF